MGLKVIITGVTGMVGEGVLLECIQHPAIDEILLVNRKPSGMTHPKIKEILHVDFYKLEPIENRLKGYNACFFCLGVTSIGKKEEEYYKLTYSLTMHMAEILARQNPMMTFCYVSGAGTDSTEVGKRMWARVKGKTENHLMKLPFKQVYAFRPGYIHPTPGMKNAHAAYKYIGWMYPGLRKLFPDFLHSMKELGIAMINATLLGYERKIIEVKDIIILAARS
jgi:hypothetical protein